MLHVRAFYLVKVHVPIHGIQVYKHSKNIHILLMHCFKLKILQQKVILVNCAAFAIIPQPMPIKPYVTLSFSFKFSEG